MGAPVVPAFDIAISPRAGGSFAFLIRRVMRGIAAFVPIARRRRLGAVVLTYLFGHKGRP
eukprot:3066323-Pleurochrysis_carterae.AAC.2